MKKNNNPSNCAFKYRLYPCRNKQVLDQMLGNARFMWNAMLGLQKAHYQAMREYYGNDRETPNLLGKPMSMNTNDALKEITILKNSGDYDFLKISIARSGDSIQQNLKRAWQDFFKMPERGMPKFKSKHGIQSFQTDRSYKIFFNEGKLTLKKERFHFKINSYDKVFGILERGGYPKMITVSRVPSGKYYLSIQFHDPGKGDLPKLGSPLNPIGIDVGVKDLYVDSNGHKEPNTNILKSYSTRLARLQKKLSGQEKKGQNWKKTKKKIAKLHWRIANIRRDRTHELTKELTDAHDLICIEDLKLSNMTKRPKKKEREDGKGYEPNNASSKAGLNRNILDANLGEFRRQLEYKSKWKGGEVIAVNTFYPSSKLCSECGHKNKELKLSHRSWICTECGSEHDRDFNAAKNILAEGERVFAIKKKKEIGHSTPKLALKELKTVV